MEPWIGVDLDGTLAHYDHWRGVEHIGIPILPMLDRILVWLHEGKTVKIFTARVCEREDPQEAAHARFCIQQWLESVGLPKLEVTNIKDFGMISLWDDRAVAVKFNTGAILGRN
jgi:hypothetical protein